MYKRPKKVFLAERVAFWQAYEADRQSGNLANSQAALHADA
jgi:hypothetical protein